MTIRIIPNNLTHWQIDALGGTLTEHALRGKIDGATFSVDSGGATVTIPSASGGNKVRYIRGVYLNTVSFTWDGFWAAPDGSPVNYYVSAANNGTDTVITISPSLAAGTQVQVFYTYSTTQALTPKTFFDAYPCYYRCYEGPFPFELVASSGTGRFSAAVDAEQYFAVACRDAFAWTSNPQWLGFLDAIIKKLREYDTASAARSTMEDFNHLLSDRPVTGLYSGCGASDAITFFDTVLDPVSAGSRSLKTSVTVSSGGYAYWGRGSSVTFVGNPSFQFKFKGGGTGKRYMARLCTDANKTQTLDTVYWFGFSDHTVDQQEFNVPLSSIYKLKNVPYDGNIQPTAWWSYAGAGATITVAEAYKGFIWDPYEIYYYATDVSWSLGTGTYAGAGVNVPTGVLSTGEADVNFLGLFNQAMTLRVKIEDANNTPFYYDVVISGPCVQKISVPWASFGSPVHPLKKVYFEVVNAPASGSFSIFYIRFGPALSLTGASGVSFYQFDFPQNGASTALWDDVGFIIDYPDSFKDMPYFSYQWSDLGALSWRGPTYSGYLSPAAYYMGGYASVAESMAAFLLSAQTAYATNYSVAAGPFMPVHTRGLYENLEYAAINVFTWNGPDTNTDWGGFQYRALAALAHYYWLSGNATAKTVLDNWMSWLSTRITDTGNGDGTHHTYETPSTFTKNTGTYTSAYNADFHALIAQAMMFKYWRDGDAVALTWYRRLLDDLVYNRVNKTGAKAGSWTNGSYTYGFVNGEVGKALGMLINGRPGGVINHPLIATAADIAAFTNLYNYFVNNTGTAKPCALSQDWLPLHTYEAVTQSIGKVWVSDTAATSEGISICLYFALDYARYTGNRAWLDKLGQYLREALGMGLSDAFLAEIRKNVNTPNVVMELALDSRTVKLGFASAGFTDVIPCVKLVSSFQNKLDPKGGYSTRGQLTFTITGRDNFKDLIANNYLKNRRVTRKDGFIASGFMYSDYAPTFVGRITDWTRKGDDLTVTVSDDLIDASRKIPVENTAKTQNINYQNTHPVDIMKDVLLNRLGINAGYVNSTAMDFERDTWLYNWKFDRVITEPKKADEYLNELQMETNSYLMHDGEKITLKVFAPPLPSLPVDEWTDNAQILEGTFSQKSGYKDGLFNRVVVYYDYDESGDDLEPNYAAAVIAIDAGSQGASQWNETSTKTIKSKWIRTRTIAQPTAVTGVVIYHCSRNNGTGTGILAFTYDAVNGHSLTWTAPNGGAGAAVKVTQSGKFQVFSSDATKWIRVIVDTTALPASNKTDNLVVTALNGDLFATTLATKLLSRFRNPASLVSFEVDINSVATGTAFIKPTDMKDITTDEACENNEATWNKERILLTSVKPDFARSRVAIEGIETKMYRRYGFIAPAGMPDYPSASTDQRRYGFVGNVNNKVNVGAEDGFYVWFLPWAVLFLLLAF